MCFTFNNHSIQKADQHIANIEDKLADPRKEVDSYMGAY